MGERLSVPLRSIAARAGLLGLAALWSGLLLPTLTRADDTHYQSVLIGDRAFGMGGAATGLAADTSSTFYNPGALAELPNRSFSASLGLTAFQRTRVLNGVRGPGSSADLTQSSSRSLPVFSAALLRFGPRGAGGLRRHAMAFSTLYPATVDLTLRVDLLHPVTGVPSTVRVDHNYRRTLYGLSYALHLTDAVSFGVTAYLATQRMTHRETLLVARGGTPVADGGFTGIENQTSLTSIAVRSYSLVPRVGMLFRPNERVSFGLTFQPPGVPLRSRASLSQQSSLSFVDPDTGVTTTGFDLVEQRGLSARMPIPWMLRAGMGAYLSNSLTLAFDLSVHGAVRARQILPGANADALGRTPFMPVDTARRTTVDGALGLEWVLRDGVTLRVGAFTNRSAAPRVPDSTNAYRPQRVHHYGGSMGLGIHVGPYHLTFGLAGTRGRGQALSVDADLAGSNVYARTNVEERVLFLFVTGATRSVARLAQSALHRVQNRGRDPEDPEPGEGEAAQGAGDADQGADDAGQDAPATLRDPDESGL